MSANVKHPSARRLSQSLVNAGRASQPSSCDVNDRMNFQSTSTPALYDVIAVNNYRNKTPTTRCSSRASLADGAAAPAAASRVDTGRMTSRRTSLNNGNLSRRVSACSTVTNGFRNDRNKNKVTQARPAGANDARRKSVAFNFNETHNFDDNDDAAGEFDSRPVRRR